MDLKGKTKKREWKILYLVGIVMTGFVFLTMTTLIFILWTQQTMVVGGILGSTLYNVSNRLATDIEKYESSPWLLDYWENNEDSLNLDPGQLKDKDSELYKARERALTKDPYGFTVEQAEGLPDEKQKLFAEYCYIMLEKEFVTFEKAEIEVTSCCFRPEGDSVYTFFYDKNHGEKTDSPALGKNIDLPDNWQSDLQDDEERLKTGEKRFSYTSCDALGNVVFYVFRPVKHNGQTICYVICCLNWSDIERVILKASTLVGIPVTAILLIFDVILLILLYRKIVRPTGILQKAVRTYTNTRNSDDIKEGLQKLIGNNDEYGRLSVDISEMADSIDRYVSESERTAAEKQKLTSELLTAETIQKSQLPGVFPAFPERTDFGLYALMDPAKEVGGDFYDFFLIDDDHIALVIGDVSDKGIPAALLMMVCKTLIRSTLLQGMSPAEAMSHVNRQISESNAAEMFITVWLAVIELSTGKGTEINAGHEKPALLRAGGKFELVKNTHDMALGYLKDQEFTTHDLEMHHGDTLFVYSDGVPEAVSVDNELFGTDRMLSVLNEDPSLSPEDEIRNLKNRIEAFVGDADQFDDITMLCFTYQG